MSLRSFHLVFIVAGLLLALLFGAWALAGGRWGTGLLSLAAVVGLASYARVYARRHLRTPEVTP